MPINNRIAEFTREMTEWRRHIHQHPETAFEEHKTSDYVALRLHEFGIDVHRGLASTGIVGTLRGDRGDGPTIGLRADMDALDIEEANDVDYKSQNPGKMHACGHDGHTTMLLGAAKYLAETKNFAGTVHFIFQPAEENEGGGRVMIEDGLFEKFPVESIYGLHNMPGIPVGEFAIRPGPIMASFDIFEITLKGIGTHAALPDLGRDAVVAGSQLISALQTVASRTISPFDSAVVTVTQMHAGDTWNVIPEEVIIRGTTRAFKEHVQDHMEGEISRIADGIAATFSVTANTRYERRYPPTINDANETDITAAVARKVAGEERLFLDKDPMMGAEDFAFMLNEKPGAYMWIGNGPREGGCMLHNPNYDFNDEILPLGASYWAELVETRLNG
ncbi:MAG: M20 aminoacylase family protein [Pseudomonadota bacterium]|nr:M20 aminoacylase family protein [Pseudomonadota bacterium]